MPHPSFDPRTYDTGITYQVRGLCIHTILEYRVRHGMQVIRVPFIYHRTAGQYEASPLPTISMSFLQYSLTS